MENACNCEFITREGLKCAGLDSVAAHEAIEEVNMGNFRPRGLAECVQILWRRKTLIVLIAVVVLLAAAAVIVRMPRLYESRALIVVSGAIYDKTANGAQVAAVTEQITSRANLEALIQRYNLFAPIAKMDATVAQFQKEIKFETKYRSDSVGFPESFTVSYRHTDPLIAQKIVTDLVAVFDQANKTLENQAAEEAQRIKGEIADLEARLGHAGAQRIASAIRSGAASRAAGAAERQRSERSAIASSLETLKDRQFALEAQIADQKRLVAQQQEVVRTSPPPPDDLRAGNSYGALLKRRADLEAQIQDYSSKFTDKYPKLVQAREQLVEINQRIAQAGAIGEQVRATAASPASLELRNLERELSRMQTELEVVRREIGRKQQAASGIPSSAFAPSYTPAPAVSIVDPGVSGADYGSEGLRERYTALLRREDAIREFQPSTAGPGTPFFQMVDQPNLPESPAAPIRSRLMMIALVIALTTGVIAAGAVEARRMSMIYDERDVNYFLGVPVVALIPETLTNPERVRAGRQLFKRRLRHLAFAAAAVPLVALLLDATRIFQILGSK
jgi:uncharacterized protein involved in exopolysaccharide biosynthesis